MKLSRALKLVSIALCITTAFGAMRTLLLALVRQQANPGLEVSALLRIASEEDIWMGGVSIFAAMTLTNLVTRWDIRKIRNRSIAFLAFACLLYAGWTISIYGAVGSDKHVGVRVYLVMAAVTDIVQWSLIAFLVSVALNLLSRMKHFGPEDRRKLYSNAVIVVAALFFGMTVPHLFQALASGPPQNVTLQLAARFAFFFPLPVLMLSLGYHAIDLVSED